MSESRQGPAFFPKETAKPMNIIDTTGRRYITVIAVGNDGNVERRWTISGTTEAKLTQLRIWTAEAYAETFGEPPRAININDWPVLGTEQHVHGVEGATFKFPILPPPDESDQ